LLKANFPDNADDGSINLIARISNTYANFPNIGRKPNKIVTISIEFQDFGEGIDQQI